ncbi:MAG TPA: glycosyltransferase family 39 protein [Acidimicrobiales bacterium]|nr:glycosyltransferase family 39 protein [Acidimicrobiales bacterium]
MTAPGRNIAAPRSAPLTRSEVVVIGLLVATGVGFRLFTGSPLWLDEALSVNIASLPIGDIGDALRRDGHPPLYYWFLHAWMELVGTGDVAVRSLSGLFGLVSLPLAYEAGRRRAGHAAGLCVLALTALTPWCVRYATEARMYALVLTLVFAGWLLADDLLRAPSRWRWAALAVVTSGGLLSHYWTIHLGIASVLLLAWTWWRAGRTSEVRRGVVRVAAALAAGAVLFLPWVPAFLDQLAKTGTPWAAAGRPTAAATELLGALGGGARYAEAVLFGVGFYVLVLFGLTLLPEDRSRAVVDFASVPGVRGEVALGLVTPAVGTGVGLLTESAFQARYAAAFVPFLLVAAGVGLARLPAPWPRRVAGGSMALFAGVGLVANVVDERTQGEQLADVVAANAGPDDLVVICPDQLGPATLRALPDEVAAVGLPAFERPVRIDWRDYESRNEAADPAEAVDRVLDDVGPGTVWMVLNTGYRTYEGYCEGVLAGLQDARPATELVVEGRPGQVFEPMHLYRFLPEG